VIKPKASERGVALLVVLLLVGVMSALAVAMLEDIRFALRRASNIETLSQAQFYALGAETLAKARLQTVLAQRAGLVTLDGGWNGMPVVFPVDNGAIRLRLADRGGCFNLNSVVTGEPGTYVFSETGAAQFRALLTVLEVPEGDAVRLTDALVDWIDSDSAPRAFGAEDETYQRLSPAYRTAGELLSEESELRAVRGVSEDVYRRLRPFVCALPLAALTEVNINTISPGEAPVLSALYFGRLPVETARRIIERRPAGGWEGQGAFLQDPLLEIAARQSVEPPVRQLVVRTRYFSLEGRVDFAGTGLPYSALLEAAPNGTMVTAARRWTPAE
jgi:general secretion pathway protein K